MDIDKVIKEAQELLMENSEWKERYKGYAQTLLTNSDSIAEYRSRFKEITSLRYYISTTNAKKAKSKLLLDVRYRGQSVATLTATKNDISISTKGKNDNNKNHFSCDVELDDDSWKSDKAREFRKKFSNRYDTRNDTKKSNDEHHVESLLLSEFSKRNGAEKSIIGIQPVKICGNRFGMPTPVSASNHVNPLKYSNQYGGGIDIFARTGRGRLTYLTVIEVKDKNKPIEPPKYALKQAIQYAVFIRELLRSESGEDWYKIFGFKGPVPKKLKIRTACAMPDDIPEKSFAEKSFTIGIDEIECHYIYFKYDGQRLSNFQTSLNSK